MSINQISWRKTDVRYFNRGIYYEGLHLKAFFMVKTLPLETYFSPSTTIVNNNSKVTILAE